MATIQKQFSSYEECEAFIEGILYVNDSAINSFAYLESYMIQFEDNDKLEDELIVDRV